MSFEEKKRIGLLTSGGDSPGMNACIRSVVRACIYHNVTPYGIREGYQGLIENKIFEMDAGSVKHIIHQGGTILKSARSKEFKTEQGQDRAWENVQAHDLDGLVVIGGDGTFKGAMAFGARHHFPIVGIPGTIDNDIYGTDHTVGFDTATNTVVDAVDKIRDTATSHNRLFFIEVMGRDAGFIALNSGIAAGAEEILIPEKNRNINHLFESLKQTSKRNKSSRLVVVAEGDRNGSVYDLEKKVRERFGDQYETKVTILGHIQRGGRPTCADRVLASRLGVHAVEALIDGQHYVMVGIRNKKIVYTNFEQATKQNPEMDEELIRVANIISI